MQGGAFGELVAVAVNDLARPLVIAEDAVGESLP